MKKFSLKLLKKMFSGVIEIAQFYTIKQNNSKKQKSLLDIINEAKPFSDTALRENITKNNKTEQPTQNIDECYDLSNHFSVRYLGEISNNFFVKFQDSPSMFSLNDNEMVLISPAVNINYDENGKREWRCVVINGKLHSISRYYNEKDVYIEPNVYDFANSVTNNINKIKDFPKTYVLDIFEYKTQTSNAVMDICEINDLTASGLNIYNDLAKDYYNNELTK